VQPVNCWPNASRWVMKLVGRLAMPSRSWRPKVSTLS